MVLEKVPSCDQERQSALDDAGQYSREAFFIPDCEPAGLYKAVQCHRPTGYCWCVLVDTGRPIPGTSTRYRLPPSPLWARLWASLAQCVCLPSDQVRDAWVWWCCSISSLRHWRPLPRPRPHRFKPLHTTMQTSMYQLFTNNLRPPSVGQIKHRLINSSSSPRSPRRSTCQN